MEWNNGSLIPSPYTSYNYYYNYNYNLDEFPVLEAKKPEVESVVGGVDEKKKKNRLSQDQLESLERCFQEDGMLDPDTKMKLSKELGLQPRQIAVWFQNRRARWRTKQLEYLYHTLKQEFDTISKEKHTLQQEVLKLRSMLGEQTMSNEEPMAYEDASGEATVESTSVGVIGSCNNYTHNNVEDLVKISGSGPPFWWGAEAAHLPSYP
ncbi:putative homeobox-leucine zipper protein ATHB-51 [Cucurbita maxima]|uniref:Homeobox-leucine zipper protein n=1 Tax=Cucurbita maxima TaxID=3661 RepID=A0A6J1IJF1_CUCMA|nr:putative homeobox-leucine zipper protein ATHB-51 [Cucurbita maxima]